MTPSAWHRATTHSAGVQAPCGLLLRAAVRAAWLVAGTGGLAAHAQPSPQPDVGAPAQAAVPAPDAAPAPWRIGSATTALLALQAGGQAASATPRPIAGDVARLSYQRYLDSFRLPIPASFQATVGPAEGAR